MATSEEIAALRSKLGETIPSGGTEADTLFTNDQISAWYDASANIYAAALEGWEAKLAHWSNLVNVTDGASSRAFSDLMEHAQAMIKYFSGKASGAPAYNRVRTRIGSIRRT